MKQPKHFPLTPSVVELLNISAQYFDLPTCGDTDRNQECHAPSKVCRFNLFAAESITLHK